MTIITDDRVIETSGTYRLTEADSVAAVKLDGRLSPVLRIVYALVGASLFAFCLLGTPDVRIIAALALLGGIVGETFTRHIIIPARRRQSYRRNELLHNEFTIELSDRDIRIFSIRTDVTLTADKVTKWREGKHHILIYVARRTYFVIPKRLAVNSFDLEALRARLGQYAGALAA